MCHTSYANVSSSVYIPVDIMKNLDDIELNALGFYFRYMQWLEEKTNVKL